MKKYLLTILVTMVLISACSTSPVSTPYTLEPIPTLTIEYQVIGSTKNTFMVVVNPKSNTDRAGLLAIGERLCLTSPRCKVWFWDDINKADTSYPVAPEKEAALIAFYTSDRYTTYESELKVFTLGDQ